MQIAVDATALYGRYGGVEYALWNLLAALAPTGGSDKFSVFIPADGPPVENLQRFGSSWNWIRLPFRGNEKAKRILWQQGALTRQVRELQCDLLHAPTYVMPWRVSIPAVLTIYDLIALHHPKYATRPNRLHYHLLMHRSISLARRIIVPSEPVRQAVVSMVPNSEEKLRVVPLGVEPAFMAPLATEQFETVRRRYQLPPRFLLFVGNFEPKKNLPRLLQALRNVPGAPPLVLVGGGRPWKSSLPLATDTDRVLNLGYVPRRDLPALYAMCEAFVFPSLAEGFGLPVLEALAAGAAVVASHAVPLTGLSEVSLLCDPLSVSSIAEGVTKALEPALRQHLQVKAKSFAQSYTWARVAQQTREIYREAADQG